VNARLVPFPIQRPNVQQASTVDEAIDVEATEDTEEPQETSARGFSSWSSKYNVPTAISIDTETGMSVTDFVAQYKLDTHEEKYLGLARVAQDASTAAAQAGLIVTLTSTLSGLRPPT